MSEQQPEALQLADELENDHQWLAQEEAIHIASMLGARDELRRQHAEIERLTVERDAAIDARRAAQLRQEQLTAEIVSLEPMRQRAADIERLAAERNSLRAELAEQEVAHRIGCACTPDFYLASYAGGAAPGGIYSWSRMGLQRTTDAATSWVEYVPAKDAQATAPELLACLIEARDDVAAELQRCREAAGYPSTDRRLAAQETLIARVDAAIAAAELAAPQPPVQSVSVENQALLELAAEIDKRFQSMNPVPVEKAVVPASEWKALLTLILAQPPAQPVKRLTEEQIVAIAIGAGVDPEDEDDDGATVFAIARAIERAHGIDLPAGEDKPC